MRTRLTCEFLFDMYIIYIENCFGPVTMYVSLVTSQESYMDIHPSMVIYLCKRYQQDPYIDGGCSMLRISMCHVLAPSSSKACIAWPSSAFLLSDRSEDHYPHKCNLQYADPIPQSNPFSAFHLSRYSFGLLGPSMPYSLYASIPDLGLTFSVTKGVSYTSKSA